MCVEATEVQTQTPKFPAWKILRERMPQKSSRSRCFSRQRVRLNRNTSLKTIEPSTRYALVDIFRPAQQLAEHGQYQAVGFVGLSPWRRAFTMIAPKSNEANAIARDASCQQRIIESIHPILQTHARVFSLACTGGRGEGQFEVILTRDQCGYA